jgi:hypothetical protein
LRTSENTSYAKFVNKSNKKRKGRGCFRPRPHSSNPFVSLVNG